MGNLEGEQKQKLCDYVKTYTEKAGKDPRKLLELYSQHVRTARIAKAYDKTNCKLEIGITAITPSDEVWQIMKQHKIGKEMPGLAPPGHMEDLIQQHLEAMGEDLKLEI